MYTYNLKKKKTTMRVLRKWGPSMPNPNKEAMLRSRENVYLINGTVTERLPKLEPCTKATVETCP